MNRVIDYLTQNLDLEVRQTIAEKLKRLPDQTIKMILEKDNDYPSFQSMGYDTEDINAINNNLSYLFTDINNYMLEKGISPLFTNPLDTYLSSQEYEYLMSEHPEYEKIAIKGNSYSDYPINNHLNEQPSNKRK